MKKIIVSGIIVVGLLAVGAAYFASSSNNSVFDQALNPQNHTDALIKKQAPEFVGITNWINSDPLTMESLKGKVVLIDFWTYSCINCIRTLPYVTSWYEKYKDKGLVV